VGALNLGGTIDPVYNLSLPLDYAGAEAALEVVVAQNDNAEVRSQPRPPECDLWSFLTSYGIIQMP